MKKIDISIIVPIYNAEEYLKRCIDSLVNQTKKEIEIVLINDGSTDNSEKIIKSYKDDRIKYFKNKNQGIGKTRNFGIEKACGKYQKDCTELEGWTDSNCQSGYCNASSCSYGYNTVTEYEHYTTWCYSQYDCSRDTQNGLATVLCPFRSKEHDHICCERIEDCAFLFTEYESAPDDAQIAENHCEPIP